MATGAQTLTLQCFSGDGASVTATLNYDGTSGTPSSLVVANTATRSASVVLTLNGVAQTVQVAKGTRTYTTAQLASLGLTNVLTQLGNVSAVSP